MEKHNTQTLNKNKSNDAIRTFVFADLPEKEKEKFMEFMINNNVEFVQDSDHNYIATIKIINQNNTNNEESIKQNKKVDNNEIKEEENYQQENIDFEDDQNQNQEQEQNINIKTMKPKKTDKFENTKADLGKSLKQTRKKSPLTARGNRQESNNRYKPPTRIENVQARSKSSNRRRKVIENIEEYEKFSKILTKDLTETGIRPKRLNGKDLQQTMEDLYTARFIRDTSYFKAQLKKGNPEEISDKSFPQFIYDFYKKKNKGVKYIQKSCSDLL